MFPLFETIKILDGVPQYLGWHQKRFEWSFLQLYRRKPKVKIEEILVVPSEFELGVVKCRFCYNDHSWSVSFQNYQPKVIESFQLIYNNTIAYSLKYSDRKALASLVDLRGACDEIIIIKDGFITDTSYSNLIFLNGKEWYTPAQPLLNGTNRARLIDQGIIKIAEIKIDDLSRFSKFKMINAMLDHDTQPAFDISAIKY